jgi:hypothetical protein
MKNNYNLICYVFYRYCSGLSLFIKKIIIFYGDQHGGFLRMNWSNNLSKKLRNSYNAMKRLLREINCNELQVNFVFIFLIFR